jgi:hypothetical protein
MSPPSVAPRLADAASQVVTGHGGWVTPHRPVQQLRGRASIIISCAFIGLVLWIANFFTNLSIFFFLTWLTLLGLTTPAGPVLMTRTFLSPRSESSCFGMTSASHKTLVSTSLRLSSSSPSSLLTRTRFRFRLMTSGVSRAPTQAPSVDPLVWMSWAPRVCPLLHPGRKAVPRVHCHTSRCTSRDAIPVSPPPPPPSPRRSS